MVKGGGTKRKAEMKKITNKASRATTFSKRRDGLYSKAAQLCLLSHAQIAVIAATPSSSSNSNASFYSFGHSSVESIVSAYLSGQRLPHVSYDTKETREDLGICLARKDLGLGFWWDDEKLVNSKNPVEIMEAIESMKVLMRHVEGLEDQTLIVDEELKKNKGMVEISDKKELSPDLDEWTDMDLDQLIQDCDDVPPLVSNTDKEEEGDQNVSEKTCCNNTSLPEAVGRSLEEETMGLDLDTIFEGLVDNELFWSDDLLFM